MPKPTPQTSSPTIKGLAELRPLGIGLFRPILAEDPEAFDLYWELASGLSHPMLKIEVWGWLVAAKRENMFVSASP